MPLTLGSLLAILLGAAAITASVPALGEPLWSVASWPEPGRGNHRALVRVEEAAPAVRIRIEWRRRDRQPEKKDVRVYAAATGERVRNVARIAVTREAGDLAFEPIAGPGDYEVYYLPYNPGVSNFDDPGTYFAPENTADPSWRAVHGVDDAGIASGAWRRLPEARTIEIQARGEFHRMDPMEVIATEEEVAGLLARHPNAPCLLFPEDRTRPIRMPDDLPLRWVRKGPSSQFLGEARPGEQYAFQIGVWAARRAISSLSVTFPTLTSASGRAIPASAFSSINLSGSDWLGRSMKPTFSVGKGMVRPLWVLVDVPKGARGRYTGQLVVRPTGVGPIPVTVTLEVKGAPLPNGGVDDLWRMARLRWLDSKLGLEETVVPPYTPIKVDGRTVRILGREVRFGANGLPESVRCGGREVLAGPVEVRVTGADGPLAWKPGRVRTLKASEATLERAHVGAAGPVSATTRWRMEFDGCLMAWVTLKAEHDVDLADVRLETPVRADVARFAMGFAQRGGFRPREIRWKWNLDRADNQIWLGDADAGLQLHLRGSKDDWDVVTLRGAGLPDSWHNGGKGGCDVVQEGDRVVVRAYTGPRRLIAGKPLTLHFRYLITPFRPLDKRHWSWRYGDTNRDANILHVHHATPENAYINYPFLKADALRDLVRRVRSAPKRLNPGALSYPAGEAVRLDRGALHVWARVLFDPSAGQAGQPLYNQPLASVDLANGDQLGFYWNIDVRGLRAYVRNGHPGQDRYPSMVDAPAREWKRGERHLLTLSWGDRLAIYIDGKLRAEGGYAGLAGASLDGARLSLAGHGFAIEVVRVTREPYGGEVVHPEVRDGTLLLDTFARVANGRTQPERGPAGELAGTTRVATTDGRRELRLEFKEVPGTRNGVNLYYTVRELSNHVVEMWPLRSLGDEIFQTREQFIYSVDKTFFGQPGGGYPWLQEHLVNGYVPAWRQPLPDGDHDAAIGTQGLSRWHNYYVEGMRWLMEHTGIDGLYLDGIGYDREIMKRIARVMHRANPNYRINFHSGDNFTFMDWRTSPANSYMEHFPYISNLWMGEMYDYDRSPDYWLVEISGIPFGLTSEMLNYENGGNAYRGMVFGMTGRQHASVSAMWRFWDEFGIQDAEWLGWWSPKCPVRTDNPEVLATVYRKKGKSLIALAHWPSERRPASAVARVASAAPRIDGHLDDAEWRGAAVLGGFTQHNSTGSPAIAPTEVRLTWDAQRLYIGFRCGTPGGPPKAAVTERDGPVYEDDAVELFIQPDPARPRYLQFVGNSAGAFYDGEGANNAAWNGDWEYRASVREGFWEGEAVVTWASLGMAPPSGEATIGLNVCRDHRGAQSGASCWSPVSGGFHNPSLFGRLTLTERGVSTVHDAASGPQPPAARLRIDWKALGIDPARATLTAPAIEHFQPAARFRVEEPIVMEPAKGWLLVLE